jgi:tetratricopeptide (TPR) repeat protein
MLDRVTLYIGEDTGGMDPIIVAGGSGNTAGAPQLVFLSHTSDLGSDAEPSSFVAAAVRAVIRARHAVADMAYFAARDTSPADLCVATVTESDVYVGIIGFRYGSPVHDRPDVSYTELEFEVASEQSRPRLIFIVREDSPYMPRANERPEFKARQDAFRARLLDAGLTTAFVASPADLEINLYQALVQLSPPPLAQAQALLASLPTDTLPSRAPLPAGPHMPIPPNSIFVGRSDELLQVAAALSGDDTIVALGQVVASTGLGGLGKTQLAVELVHRYGRFFAGGVFWLSFASANEIPLQVAACAGSGAVGLEANVAGWPLEDRVKLVMGAWQSAVPRLLVFDNCEEESLLETWRPTSGGCRVLVTSRRSRWSPTMGVTAIPMDLLPRPDSIELLRRYRPDLAPDDPGLEAVADRLGDLPLALHLAGSYLRNYRAEVGMDEYLAELDQPELIRHSSLLGEGLDDSPSPTRHVQSLAHTFTLCLGRLDRERAVDQVAIALLARMAWMAPGEAVPRELLGRTLEEVDQRRRADGLRRLGAVGLVEEGEGWLRLHRLVVHFVRQQALDPTARAAVARALIAFGEDAYRRRLTASTLAAVIPHLVDVARMAGEGSDDERLAFELYTAAALALGSAGDLKAARSWAERAAYLAYRVLDPDHPDTATYVDYMAELLRLQGELAAARSLFEYALAIRERVLGPDHPDTAISLNYLGDALRDHGEMAAARLSYERALAIRERMLGPNHPLTAESLNNVALVLRDHGELAAAVPLFERALAIYEGVQGPYHPDTAIALHNLGVLLRDQGEMAGARALIERALAIREQMLGPNHLQTAISLRELGVLLSLQDELAAAVPLLERALAIRERALGPDHLSTAMSLHDRALLHLAQGELDPARSLFRRALPIRERVLGHHHSDTIATRDNLANLAHLE